MTDSLAAGGAERVAVNLANLMPRERYRMHLCTTRCDGPLEHLLSPDVGRVRLRRSRTLDWRALKGLVAYIRGHNIRILHAHGTSIFVCVAASLWAPRRSVIWHDHCGGNAIKERPVWLYRSVVRRARRVIAVNHALAAWSLDRLGIPDSRVSYVPNFVCRPSSNNIPYDLPGTPGKRIVCVANLRPEKDHASLIRAMEQVVRVERDASLLLVGNKGSDNRTHETIKTQIQHADLERNVFILGERDDVPGILRLCDVGVLSSVCEGLPLALLEYGNAGLPAVVTRVGQCPEVLDDGRAGLLVTPQSVDEIAEAIVSLLTSSHLRSSLGSCLRDRVAVAYSAERTIQQMVDIYDESLQAGQPLNGSTPQDVCQG